jgi:phenylalanyl-tRNA synthetase beta chain
LQRRLTAIGLRPINALVDITNFFTFDIGRPLHVFDAGAIAGTTLKLRRGDGTAFAALNGRTIAPGTDDLVIADDSGPISLAGIMGGQATGTTETTNHVFVECALFDPVHIALTGRRLGLHSDARQRFERGVDQALPPAALEAATRMILDFCGGEAGTVVSAGAEPAWRRQASLRFERIAGLGGLDMDADQAVAILQNLGFEPLSRDEASVTVAVPPWRNDVAGSGKLDQYGALDPARGLAAQAGATKIEPECDLLEEVLRIKGLDSIEPVSLPAPGVVRSGALTPRQARTALARRVLAARGLAECVTYSFAARAEIAAFGEVPDSLVLKNPIAADLDVMRPTPLVTLAQAARRNFARGAGAVALFEIGPAFSASGQVLMAAGMRLGEKPRHWQKVDAAAGTMDAKSDAIALLGALGVPLDSLSVTRDAPGYYHPGRSGVVRQGPKIVLAHFGEPHPALLEKLGLPGPAAAFEILLDSIPDPKRRRRAPPDLPPLQPVARDFAFVVNKSVEAETVLRAVRSVDRHLISRVSLFDVYEGDNLPSSEKSLGVEVVFQPRERTLTDKDLESACAKVIDAVVKATSARLR